MLLDPNPARPPERMIRHFDTTRVMTTKSDRVGAFAVPISGAALNLLRDKKAEFQDCA
jgi:hypothetical protein